jgi:hypothetical protein
MARPVDNLSTFLNAVKEQAPPAPAEPQQRSAPGGNAVQQILTMVLASPEGIDLGVLYKQTALDFSVFAEAVERLKKLGGIRVVKGPAGEVASPGPNCQEVASLVS